MPKRYSYDLKSYHADASKIPILSREEENYLANIIQNEESSKDEKEDAIYKLVEHNLRLVMKIANDFVDMGLSRDDLVMEGNEGLKKAATKFRSDKGAKFSSYAAWWIKQSIRKSIGDKGSYGFIRIDSTRRNKINRVEQFISKFENDHHVAPTSKQIADGISMSVRQVDILLEQMKIKRISYETIAENGFEIPVEPDMSIETRESMDIIRRLFDTLDDRQQEVLRYRCGLDGYPTLTLEVISKKFDVTAEMIRIIQRNAIEDLRRKYYELDK